MFYFSAFGYVQKSWEMILGFLIVSLASSFVESLPISTELDDNLTVTLTSLLLGNLVFWCQELLLACEIAFLVLARSCYVYYVCEVSMVKNRICRCFLILTSPLSLAWWKNGCFLGFSPHLVNSMLVSGLVRLPYGLEIPRRKPISLYIFVFIFQMELSDNSNKKPLI
jgi:hypothetical protein